MYSVLDVSDGCSISEAADHGANQQLSPANHYLKIFCRAWPASINGDLYLSHTTLSSVSSSRSMLANRCSWASWCLGKLVFGHYRILKWIVRALVTPQTLESILISRSCLSSCLHAHSFSHISLLLHNGLVPFYSVYFPRSFRLNLHTTGRRPSPCTLSLSS